MLLRKKKITNTYFWLHFSNCDWKREIDILHRLTVNAKRVQRSYYCVKFVNNLSRSLTPTWRKSWLRLWWLLCITYITFGSHPYPPLMTPPILMVTGPESFRFLFKRAPTIFINWKKRQEPRYAPHETNDRLHAHSATSHRHPSSRFSGRHHFFSTPSDARRPSHTNAKSHYLSPHTYEYLSLLLLQATIIIYYALSWAEPFCPRPRWLHPGWSWWRRRQYAVPVGGTCLIFISLVRRFHESH